MIRNDEGHRDREGAGGVHGAPSVWLPRLARLLDEQATLCRQVEEMAPRQRRAIAAGESDELLAILGARQALVDRIVRLGEDLAPFQARWGELMGMLGKEERSAVEGLVNELAASIGRIGDADREDQRTLERQREAVAAELAGVHRGRDAMAAYGRGGGSSEGARFQDREG